MVGGYFFIGWSKPIAVVTTEGSLQALIIVVNSYVQALVVNKAVNASNFESVDISVADCVVMGFLRYTLHRMHIHNSWLGMALSELADKLDTHFE